MEARAEIAHSLAGNRDLLYLDVALENSIRGAAERGVGSAGGLQWLPPERQALAVHCGLELGTWNLQARG